MDGLGKKEYETGLALLVEGDRDLVLLLIRDGLCRLSASSKISSTASFSVSLVHDLDLTLYGKERLRVDDDLDEDLDEVILEDDVERDEDLSLFSSFDNKSSSS